MNKKFSFITTKNLMHRKYFKIIHKIRSKIWHYTKIYHIINKSDQKTTNKQLINKSLNYNKKNHQ